MAGPVSISFPCRVTGRGRRIWQYSKQLSRDSHGEADLVTIATALWLATEDTLICTNHDYSFIAP